MDTLIKDLAYALRTLRRDRAFAAIAVVTIALGIGASTAIFSVVNAVLLAPLPYANAERLVILWADMRNRGVTEFPTAPGDYHDLLEQATHFEALAGVVPFRQPIFDNNGDPEQIQIAGVTPNFFGVLGARMAVGRDFQETDGTPQAAPQPQAQGAQGAPPQQLTAILSHDFWQRRYGGDPGVLGRIVDVGGGRAEIVGVLQPGFELLFPPHANIPRSPDMWTALRVDYEAGSRINVFLRVVGKLRPGVTIEQAQRQMDAITADLRVRFPIKETSGFHQRLEPMHAEIVDDVRQPILALMGAVLFVLLIACANVANLLLVRASSRERELAVRAALGGSRWRLLRQMLGESLMLATGGALLGLLLASLGIRLLLALRPEDLPRIESISIEPTVLAFTALAAMLSAVVFGMLPALRASRPNVADVLRESGRTPALRAGRLLRNGVVVAEVALSFVLLIGSGLMLRSFVALQSAEPGFEPDRLLTFVLNPPPRQDLDLASFNEQIRQRLEALPGVQSVSAGSQLPLDGGPGLARWGTEEALTNPAAFQQATFYGILLEYFETLNTRLIDGRVFTEADYAPDLRLVVVDRVLAAKAFPNESAVGKRILARVAADEPEWYEIIGVVDHQRSESLAADGRESIYLAGFFAGRWAVRTEGDPGVLTNAVRAELTAIDPLITIAEMQPLQAFVARAMAPTRFVLVLIGIFAAIAALLAAVGLYGVLSTVVRQRTAEIGVRVAFGAPRGSIFGLVVGQGLRLSAAGIVVGLVAALVLTRLMTAMLVGVQPTDPATFATMSVAFFTIAAIACWLPARRAARLDPTVALREE
jgi:predicted permease